MLSLRSVNQFYGQNHILWNVDLDLPSGSCTGIIGRSGMGKTTLVNCIMGHLPVNSGCMTWQENGRPPENLLQYSTEQRTQMGIGYVPQGRQIFSQLSVEDNLRIALLAGHSAHHDAIPPRIYEWFPALLTLRRTRSGELSPENQQQLALARALVFQSKLLILDSPTEGMSPRLEQKMVDLIHRLNRDFGLTILLLEQRVSFIRRVADHFLLLHRGHSVAQGDVALLDEAPFTKWLAPSF